MTEADPLGNTALFDAYETTAAAKLANPTRETIDAFGAAMQDLHQDRKYWRQIGEWKRAADIAEWAAANPEAASQQVTVEGQS